MADNSFKVKNSLVLTPVDLTSLTNPQAGDLACDINDNNKIKRYDAATLAWAEVGSGGVGSLDTLFAQDFESASVSSFTQTGLSLSTSNPLHGKVSALMTHQAATSQSFKQVIAVDEKFRSLSMLLTLNIKSTATAGNVTISVYDETNAAAILASTQLQVSSATAGTKDSVSFTIPATCLSMSYTITALQEAGSPVTRIDDIICQLANSSLLETSVTVPNITAWQGYTPTFTGFGTPTAVEMEWRQVGENAEIRGKFTSGTSTAVEARVSLPNGFTSAGTSIIPSLQVAGTCSRDSSVSAGNGGNRVTLIEPSVSYVTFAMENPSNSGLTKITGSGFATSIAISFTASVPCAGLTATSDVAIPLTQSGIVQEADSYIKLYASNGYGSTNTAIPRFATLQTSIGSGILYQDSATLGNSFTAVKDGTYTFTGYSQTSANVISHRVGLSINLVAPITLSISSVPNISILNWCADSINTASTAAKIVPFAWTGKLSAGDIVRVHTNGDVLSDLQINASYQGSLKQVTVNTNSKITIPTSELRFEGASARGAVATTIVKFDTLAKIRGDAFTVTNTANDGTFVTMTKAGKLDIGTSLYFSAITRECGISINQAVLTGIPTNSELLSSEFNTTSSVYNVVWTGSVKVGDILRVYSTGVPAAGVYNNLNLLFQEQDIQVSVSNTLPQFSESDTYAKLAGNAGQVMTVDVTNIPFITILDTTNGGWNGSQFIVSESGTYNFTGSAYTVAAVTRYVDLYINGVFSKRVSDSVSTTVHLFHIQDYYSVGDIISFRFGGNGATLSNVNTYHYLNINKVGKPNVTGVDVTPFVNVPQPVSQSLYLSNTTTTLGALVGALTSNSGSSILSYNSATGVYTALKACRVSASFTARTSANTSTRPLIFVDANLVAISTSVATTNANTTTSFSGSLNAGQTLSFSTDTTSSINNIVSINATALSDQILTAPETFSTDTAPLTYAGLGTYTLSTLANAPVGTFITFTYATSTNTRTQTTTAPTQTTADMNTNGMLIYTRAFNAASTAGNPAAIAIQIGKGLKGKSLDLYKSAGKATAGSLDGVSTAPANAYGALYQGYNESTGVLLIDAGANISSSNTSHEFLFTDLTTQPSGYLVINASKNPSILGLGLQTVAARVVQTSGQSIPNTGTNLITWDAAKTYDTHGAFNAGTGTFTTPETGYYQVSANVYFGTLTYAIGNSCYGIIFKNGVATAFGTILYMDAAAARDVTATVTTGMYLVKGDTIDFRVNNNRTAGASALATAVGYNHFSIHKTSLSTGN